MGTGTAPLPDLQDSQLRRTARAGLVVTNSNPPNGGWGVGGMAAGEPSSFIHQLRNKLIQRRAGTKKECTYNTSTAGNLYL